MDSSGANLKRWKIANEQMRKAIEEPCRSFKRSLTSSFTGGF